MNYYHNILNLLNLTKIDLAQILGVHRSYIYRSLDKHLKPTSEMGTVFHEILPLQVAFLKAEKEGNVPALDFILEELDSKNSLDIQLTNAQRQLDTAEKKLKAMRANFEQAQKTVRFVNMSLQSKPKISNATHLLLQTGREKAERSIAQSNAIEQELLTLKIKNMNAEVQLLQALIKKYSAAQ